MKKCDLNFFVTLRMRKKGMNNKKSMPNKKINTATQKLKFVEKLS